jgi:hypothetical protein
VITADSPTDYGNVNGAGVVSVLKSGTNQFHGSAYGYVQDYRLERQLLLEQPATPSFPSILIPRRSSAAPSAGPSCTTSCSSSAITWDRAITGAEPVRRA